MSALIRSLARFCAGHPLDEKIFVCPSFVVGRQIGEALARESGSWVNLRFMTLPALAHEAAALELARTGRRLFTGSELLVLADTLFRDLVKADRLAYFKTLRPSPGVARTLLGALLRLRAEGLDSAAIDPGRFEVPAKGQDLRVLLGRYESSLTAGRGLDMPGLMALAAAGTRSAGDGTRHFLCPAEMMLSRVEKELLEALSEGGCLFAPSDPVFGLERPRLFQDPCRDLAASPPAPASDVERLGWLFDPGRAPHPPFKDGSLAIFRAVGPVNECREVLRRILESGTPLDDVEIIGPPGPIYVTALHDLSLRTGLAMTYGDGLPLALTTSGRVFAGLIDWIEADHPASLLGRLLAAGDMRLPFPTAAEEVPGPTVSRYLREALIGWGRDRYAGSLRLLRQTIEAKLRDPRSDEETDRSAAARARLEQDRAQVERTTEAVTSLLAFFPEFPANGPVPFEALCLGLGRALETCVVRRPDPEDRDGQALAALTAELRALAEASGPAPEAGRPPTLALDLETCLDRIRTAMSTLSAGASAPRPGHLHVSSLESGGHSGRPVTFVIGLDDATFPGRGLQDPVLLDDERRRLAPGLPTAADSLRQRLYGMAALLASLRGRVVLAYPSYDVLEERITFPSSLVLQAHRLLSGDGFADYASLDRAIAAEAARAVRSDPAGFVPSAQGAFLEGTDWWLGRLAGPEPPSDGAAAVRRHFPALAAGLHAEEARAGDALSEYEGVVKIDVRWHDPLVNRALEVSASRLESLVKCPFGYFLKYVLEIEPPEEIELDRSRWLDPLDRGSLIHEILSDFMTRATETGERVDRTRHGPLMEDAACRVIESWRSKVPPPSKAVFEKERQDIQAALEIFFRVEAARPAAEKPFAFEKDFSAVPIDVAGGGWFLLKGRIDRLDRLGPETFRILDYKTGSPKSFEELKAFGRGRIIQHALYAVAAEKVLAREGLARAPHVSESGYSFPTRRGEGREVIVREFDRAAFRSLLKDILALISNGFFVTSLKDECSHCDFEPVCGGRPAETKKRIEANAAIREALKRIGSYD